MTTNTLGQIASETMAALRAMASAEALSDPAAQAERWEACAQAVADAVKERCAQAAREHYMDMCKKCGVSPASFDRWSACAAIRSMK